MIGRAGICVALLLLAGCGSKATEDSAFGQAMAGFGGPEEFQPRFIALLKAEAPALQIGIVEEGQGGTLLLERRDGQFEYWLSPDGAQIILQDGMLHGTRGFGEGLLASEVTEPLARVHGLDPGWSDRFHTYLDGTDRTVTRTYRCQITSDGPREIEIAGAPVQTRLMRESCRSLDQEFENLYWVGPDSRDIVLSRQWSGPYVGAISTRVVPE